MCNLISLCAGGWTNYPCNFCATLGLSFFFFFFLIFFLFFNLSVMLMSRLAWIFAKTCLSPNRIAKLPVAVMIKSFFFLNLSYFFIFKVDFPAGLIVFFENDTGISSSTTSVLIKTCFLPNVACIFAFCKDIFFSNLQI